MDRRLYAYKTSAMVRAVSLHNASCATPPSTTKCKLHPIKWEAASLIYACRVSTSVTYVTGACGRSPTYFSSCISMKDHLHNRRL